MYYEVIAASAVLSAMTMPFILKFAHRNGLYDAMGGRKLHNGLIPRLGGIGMFLAFVAMMILVYCIKPGDVSKQLVARMFLLWPFAAGAVIMHIIGLLDDLRPLPAKLKLVVQTAAAVIVVTNGYGFKGFGFREDVLSGQLSWLSVILSTGWIVGVANAINFIDGLDGLAGSLSFITSFVFGVFYYRIGDMPSSLLCLSIAGIVVGFLLFNFPMPKAKLFMGDSGSLFLGFCLSVMPFLGQANAARHVMLGMGLVPSIVILALPVFDTLRVMALRIYEGKGVMTPDRQHIHYLFADSGLGTLSVIAILDFMAMILSVAVLAASVMPRSLGSLLELISLLLLGILFRYARYVSTSKAKN